MPGALRPEQVAMGQAAFLAGGTSIEQRASVRAWERTADATSDIHRVPRGRTRSIDDSAVRFARGAGGGGRRAGLRFGGGKPLLPRGGPAGSERSRLWWG